MATQQEKQTTETPETADYRVIRADIFVGDDDGAIYRAKVGEILSLTKKEAAYFIKHKCVEPYIEEE